MDIRQLRYFLRIIEAGSFSLAASRLRIAQSALSYQIARLERELGVPLLLRHSRGVTPTEAGRSVQRHAESMLRELNELRADAGSRADYPSGHIVFAATPSMSRLLAPPVIVGFRDRYPQVRLTMREETIDVIHDWLLKGQVDVGLLFDPPEVAEIETHRLLTDRLHLVGSPALRQPAASGLTLERLAKLPLVLTTTAYGWRRRLERRLLERDLRPNIRAEVDSLAVIKELVMRGFAYAVLPRSAIHLEIRDRQLWARPIDALDVTSHLTLVRLKHRESTLASEALRDLITHEVAKLET